MRLYRLCCDVCLLTFAVASCTGTALHVGSPTQTANGNASTANSPSNQNDKSDQAVFSLDLQHPEITQKILPDDGDAAKARFVQVEIIAVNNPQKHPAQAGIVGWIKTEPTEQGPFTIVKIRLR